MFQTALVTKALPGPGNETQLLRELVYVTRDGEMIVVPPGMIADGNSGPLKAVASESAGWVHDYLYRSDCPVVVSRARADEIFREALVSQGFSRVFAGVQWLAVRMLGGAHWKRKPVR